MSLRATRWQQLFVVPHSYPQTARAPQLLVNYLSGSSVAAGSHSVVLLEPDLSMVSMTLSSSGFFYPFH